MPAACLNGPTNPWTTGRAGHSVSHIGGKGAERTPCRANGHRWASVNLLAKQFLPSLSLAIKRCPARNSTLGQTARLLRCPQRWGPREYVYTCGRGPQGRVDPKTKLKALSPLSTVWGGLSKGQEGKEEASRRDEWEMCSSIIIHTSIFEPQTKRSGKEITSNRMFNSLLMQYSHLTAIIIKNSIYAALYYFTSTWQLLGNLHNTL